MSSLSRVQPLAGYLPRPLLRFILFSLVLSVFFVLFLPPTFVPQIIRRPPHSPHLHLDLDLAVIASRPSVHYRDSAATKKETFGLNAQMPCAKRFCTPTIAMLRTRHHTTSCSLSAGIQPISASSLHRRACALDLGGYVQLQWLESLVHRIS
jgi:hypothetical protein